MATPEELEAMASALLAEVQQLGKDVEGLGNGVVEVRGAIEQAGETLQAEITDYESTCEDMLAQAGESLNTMFEMVQALGGASAEAYAGELAGMRELLANTRAEVERAMTEASQQVDTKLAEVAQGAAALREVVVAVAADGVALAERSSETLVEMREAVAAGQDAAEQRMTEARSAVDETIAAVAAEQAELQSFVDGDVLSAIESAMQELSERVRETTAQVVVSGVEATRDAALDTLESGIKSVVDEAVTELLRLMNELSDQILDKADGPREKTDAMREVVDTLRSLIDPLIDRISSVRGLAASVGVSV